MLFIIPKQNFVLQASSDGPVTTFGTQRLNFDFIIVDDQIAILRADAFLHLGLIIDLRDHRLFHGQLERFTPLASSHLSQHLAAFRGTNIGKLSPGSPRLLFFHQSVSNGSPVFA